jgi:hypothetical protein
MITLQFIVIGIFIGIGIDEFIKQISFKNRLNKLIKKWEQNTLNEKEFIVLKKNLLTEKRRLQRDFDRGMFWSSFDGQDLIKYDYYVKILKNMRVDDNYEIDALTKLRDKAGMSKEK